MRFCSNGPVIPDQLLADRDAGRVVFLCGAGVSMPAGMPDFVQLTSQVIDLLNPPGASEVRRLFTDWVDPRSRVSVNARTPLDQLFNLLQQEYGREQLGKAVTDILTVKNQGSLHTKKHEIIARLSADQAGAPQIATTNFDRLFEMALPETKKFLPPALPELQHGVLPTGLTYLHGRLPDSGEESYNYVLSSADFGRAYLAQGWATSFIRQLLSKYTVVLLGYRAEDPPVKYLLQGLESSSGYVGQAIYAFDQGSPEEIDALWRDRGVRPIAYPESLSHQSLWETLDAWAERSTDLSGWRSGLISMARKGPEKLHAHERGMVAQMIRTVSGARQFADAEPPLPIEWLLVFDRNCRLAKVSNSLAIESQGYDPLNEYGLDDDPKRSELEEDLRQSDGDDLIKWRQGDDSQDGHQRLAGWSLPSQQQIPNRLWHLSRWMAKNVESPVLAWWVSRQIALHPALVHLLQEAIDKSKSMQNEIRQLWSLMFEALESRNNDQLELSWFKLKQQISVAGWNGAVVRRLESVTAPKIKVSSPHGVYGAIPPRGSARIDAKREIANLRLVFPVQDSDFPDVPDEYLGLAFEAVQRNLVRAAELLDEIDPLLFDIPTLYPQAGQTSIRYPEEPAQFVELFVGLFDRMAVQFPERLRVLVDAWPTTDPFLLDKLRLYAWNKRTLYSGEDVSKNILSMGSEQFWSSANSRELLLLLRDRWAEFSEESQKGISEKVLAGRESYDGEDEGEYLDRKMTISVMYLSWLHREKCVIAPNFVSQCLEMKSLLPRWSDKWIDDAVSTNEVRGGFVRSNEDCSELNKMPVEKIVEVAQQKTGHSAEDFLVEDKPFDGLLKSNRRRAALALFAAARRGNLPVGLWDSAISKWPKGDQDRSSRVFLERLRMQTPEFLHDIRWSIGDWLQEELPNLMRSNEKYAFSVYDELVSKVLSNGEKATESGIGQISSGGKNLNRSRRTRFHALNGFVGKALKGLFTALDSLKLANEFGIPLEFKSRFEALLDAPGEGSDHAVSLLTQQIRWFHCLDPDWVEGIMIPWFSPESPLCEPAWSGMIQVDLAASIDQGLFAQLKDVFLRLPELIKHWSWDEDALKHFNGMMIKAAVFPSPKTSALNFEEARDWIRSVDQSSLSSMIWFLSRVGMDNDQGWEKFVIPFIQGAWPKELKFHTESTSKAWLSLLEHTGEQFPIVLEAVKPFLREIKTSYLHLYYLHNPMGDVPALAEKFPKEVLGLLEIVLPSDPKALPYDLAQVLNLVEAADPSVATDRRYQKMREMDISR